MEFQSFFDLPADGLQRVEARHRVLHDHGDFFPAEALPVLFFLERGEIERFARRSGYRLGMTAEEANAREKELEEIFETSMETVGFSTRIANALANLGIVSLGGVCALSETRLLKLRNFGRKSLEELQSELGRRGVGLGMIVPGMDDPLRSVWP